MIIQSKYQSVCPICGEKINIGDNIEWSKGEKVIHQSCSEKLNQQALEDWNNKAFRVFDRVEVIEDIIAHNMFGRPTGEVFQCKGMKAEIISSETRTVLQEGKRVELVRLEEKIRKGQPPKTKTGYIYARLDQIIITKKAKMN